MPNLQAVGLLRGQGIWVDGAVLTNPADATVLVDTGQIGNGSYVVAVVSAHSVDLVYDVQHRNAANNATTNTQRRRPVAGNDDFPLPNKFDVVRNGRIRSVLVGAITGQVQQSIFYQAVEEIET